MSRLYIVGAGGFAFEVALICDRLIAAGTAQFDDYAFLDDNPEYARERKVEGMVGGPLEDHEVSPGDLYVCAIGNPVERQYVVKKLAEKGAKFTTLVDPSAVVSDRARIGSGVIICAHAFVSTFVTLGNHVHVNVSSSIGHDVSVGEFVTLSAHVDLTGGVKVGIGAFFGTHACVLPNHSIGDWARIGAGCTISRPVRSEAIVYAEPPKFLDRGK